MKGRSRIRPLGARQGGVLPEIARGARAQNDFLVMSPSVVVVGAGCGEASGKGPGPS